jgi:pimeloyl-ACP methyl ester carboxylesterase
VKIRIIESGNTGSDAAPRERDLPNGGGRRERPTNCCGTTSQLPRPPNSASKWNVLVKVVWLVVVVVTAACSTPAPHTPYASTSEAAPQIEVEQRWAALQFTTRMIQVNGVSLFVAEAGTGDLVVLLHGYPESGEEWRKVAPRLAEHHHVVIPDLRGMGWSEAAGQGYDLTTVAEDIHQLVKSTGSSKVYVVGHDWGAAVGAVYALRYRNEVAKLAFLESALAGAGFEALWDFSKPNPVFTFIPFLLLGESDTEGDTTAALLQGHESAFLHHLWAGFTGDKLSSPFLEWQPYVGAMSRPGVATSSSSYYRAAYHSAAEVRSLLVHKLDIPVLSIAGEKGIGKNQEPLVRAFANNVTQTIVLAGAGHFLAEERPSELVAALVSFLDN